MEQLDKDAELPYSLTGRVVERHHDHLAICQQRKMITTVVNNEDTTITTTTTSTAVLTT